MANPTLIFVDFLSGCGWIYYASHISFTTGYSVHEEGVRTQVSVCSLVMSHHMNLLYDIITGTRRQHQQQEAALKKNLFKLWIGREVWCEWWDNKKGMWSYFCMITSNMIFLVSDQHHVQTINTLYRYTRHSSIHHSVVIYTQQCLLCDVNNLLNSHFRTN